MQNKTITCEYVSYGHPDKVADQISDALLDSYLNYDEHTRAGIEVMIKDNVVVVGGEVTGHGTDRVDVAEIARAVVNNIGYPQNHNLNKDNIKVVNILGQQSVEISKGVDKKDSDEIGAGDQGFVVGFASNETPTCMPLGCYLAKQICLGILIKNVLGPDAKTQVTIEYNGKGEATVKSIVVSVMNQCKLEEARKMIRKAILTNAVGINEAIFNQYIKDNTNIELCFNLNGSWTIGGPIADCGLTGRKIVVDAYGGYCNVGGGAFSGKDMSKVDRSGAYMARYLAKNIVAAGIAETAKVELSYIISQPQPCAINIELTNPTFYDAENKVKAWIKENINLTPKGIINTLFPYGINSIFYNTAVRGHFGFDANDAMDVAVWKPWEQLNLVEELTKLK